MTASHRTETSHKARTLGTALCHALLVLCFSASCDRRPAAKYQGYVEGEYVYVASPLAGAVEKLAVRRGDQVHSGDLLFALECAAETAQRQQSERKLIEAKANLEDVKKGKRPTEIESATAQLSEAQAALDMAEKDINRKRQLLASGAISPSDFDLADSTYRQSIHRVEQLRSDLSTARLGAREDQIASAEAVVHENEAALARADWDLTQKKQFAPKEGAVFDTLYYEGEWAAAGKPVVALLPPENIKVRAFIPETVIGGVHLRDPVRVFADGVAGAKDGRVSFISPQAEYTPPMIYSRETRAKMVIMIESEFPREIAMTMHPGQPVDLEFMKR